MNSSNWFSLLVETDFSHCLTLTSSYLFLKLAQTGSNWLLKLAVTSSNWFLLVVEIGYD